MAEQKKLSIKDIRADQREVSLIKWPGTEKEIGLMLLRCGEIQEAHFAAVEWFQKKIQLMDGVNLAEFIREKERQEIFRMLLQPDSKRPQDRLFNSAEDVRRELDLDEVAYFQAEHQRLTEERLQRLGIQKIEAE